MSEIRKPPEFLATIASVTEWLLAVEEWHGQADVSNASPHPRVWHRGHENSNYLLEPGVYREEFTERSGDRQGGDEERRLRLERDLLVDFRITGASLFDAEATEELYFIAQHHGMKTRLLDWTTNPLAALYFAVCKGDDTPGEVLVMDASELVRGRNVDPMDIISQRHPFATRAIRESFWIRRKPDDPPIIFPLRPDNHAGRIAQQSSCFTMHMHQSSDVENATLARYLVPINAKIGILAELRRLRVDEFSIFRDLDNLSRAILRANRLKPR